MSAFTVPFDPVDDTGQAASPFAASQTSSESNVKGVFSARLKLNSAADSRTVDVMSTGGTPSQADRLMSNTSSCSKFPVSV